MYVYVLSCNTSKVFMSFKNIITAVILNQFFLNNKYSNNGLMWYMYLWIYTHSKKKKSTIVHINLAEIGLQHPAVTSWAPVCKKDILGHDIRENTTIMSLNWSFTNSSWWHGSHVHWCKWGELWPASQWHRLKCRCPAGLPGSPSISGPGRATAGASPLALSSSALTPLALETWRREKKGRNADLASYP